MKFLTLAVLVVLVAAGCGSSPAEPARTYANPVEISELATAECFEAVYPVLTQRLLDNDRITSEELENLVEETCAAASSAVDVIYGQYDVYVKNE